MVMEFPDGKKTKLDSAELLVCKECSIYYGKHEVVEECDYECGEPFSANEEIVCCGSFHYHKDCFEQRKQDLASPSKKSSSSCGTTSPPIPAGIVGRDNV